MPRRSEIAEINIEKARLKARAFNKYEFTDERKAVIGKNPDGSERTYSFRRIRALRNFGGVRKGDLGGWLEESTSLPHRGLCWIYDNGLVYKEAILDENATVRDNATVISGFISGNAVICNNATVSGMPIIYDNAIIQDHAIVCGNAKIYGNAIIQNNASIMGTVEIYDDAEIGHFVTVGGNAKIGGDFSTFQLFPAEQNQA